VHDVDREAQKVEMLEEEYGYASVMEGQEISKWIDQKAYRSCLYGF